MPCYHPMHGFIDPFFEWKTGGAKLVIKSINVKHYVHFKRGSFTEKFMNDFRMVQHPVDHNGDEIKGFIYDDYYPQEIPCGHCLGCRLDHANEWATRLIAESEYHSGNYFITLTYDPDHLPYAPVIDDSSIRDKSFFDTGEFEIVGDAPSVSLRDVQLFLKRLRKHYYGSSKSDIVYFACTEYGTKTQRPHAHLILLGLDKLDWSKKVFYKHNFAGDPLYNHPDLERIWGNGYVVIGEVNSKTAGYVARYTLKKTYRSDLTVGQRLADYKRYLRDCGKYDCMSFEDRSKLFEEKRQEYIFDDLLDHGKYYLLERERQVMSRSCGIATRYWEDHWQDLVQSNELWLAGKQRPFPAHFSRWLRVNHSIAFSAWQRMRSANAEKKMELWLDTFEPEFRKEYLEKQELIALEKTKQVRIRDNLSLYDRKD